MKHKREQKSPKTVIDTSEARSHYPYIVYSNIKGRKNMGKVAQQA